MAESKEEKFVKQLDFSSVSLAADWRRFKSQFAVFKVAKKFSAMDDEEQIANLLVLMGPDSVPIFDQFVFDETKDAEKKTLTNVLKFFDDHFEPVKSVIFERVKFNSMKQGSQPLHRFITLLQTQANNCDYGGMKDELVRDRIIVGVADDKLRDYLIDLDNLDLQRCITKAKQYISHHEQTAKISGDDVDVVQSSGFVSRGPTLVKGRQGVLAPAPGGQQRSSEGAHKRCVARNKPAHAKDFCPARRSRCNRCNLVGHWAASSLCKGGADRSASVKEVQEDLEGLFLGSESD